MVAGVWRQPQPSLPCSVAESPLLASPLLLAGSPVVDGSVVVGLPVVEPESEAPLLEAAVVGESPVLAPLVAALVVDPASVVVPPPLSPQATSASAAVRVGKRLRGQNCMRGRYMVGRGFGKGREKTEGRGQEAAIAEIDR